MVDSPVLVLNLGYEPLNVCRARRAIVLIEQSKAEMLENGSGFIRSANRVFAVPSVIRISSMVRPPRRTRTPKEAGMKLFRQPGPPEGPDLSFVFDHHYTIRKEWQKYLPAGS